MCNIHLNPLSVSLRQAERKSLHLNIEESIGKSSSSIQYSCTFCVGTRETTVEDATVEMGSLISVWWRPVAALENRRKWARFL